MNMHLPVFISVTLCISLFAVCNGQSGQHPEHFKELSGDVEYNDLCEYDAGSEVVEAYMVYRGRTDEYCSLPLKVCDELDAQEKMSKEWSEQERQIIITARESHRSSETK